MSETTSKLVKRGQTYTGSQELFNVPEKPTTTRKRGKTVKKARVEKTSSMASTLKATSADRKMKKRKFKTNDFSLYIYKVLKETQPERTIAKSSMSIMNSFMNDIFERIASEASTLSKLNKDRKTRHLSSRDIQGAVKLVLPGDIMKHAVAEGTKAVARYTETKKK